jgi:hypothetical protein
MQGIGRQRVKDVGGKVQSQVASYPFFVINGLVGIKGTSVSAVLDFIVVDWIAKNQTELDAYGISIDTWRRAPASKRKTGRAVLLLPRKKDPLSPSERTNRSYTK